MGHEVGRRVRTTDGRFSASLSRGYGVGMSAGIVGERDERVSLADSTQVHAEGGARLDLVRARLRGKVGDDMLGVDATGTASAGVDLSAKLNATSTGMSGSLSAMVGVEARGNLTAHVGPVDARVSGGAIAGYGVAAKFEVGIKGDKFVLGTNVAAAYGVGVSGGTTVEINIESIRKVWRYLMPEQKVEIETRYGHLMRSVAELEGKPKTGLRGLREMTLASELRASRGLLGILDDREDAEIDSRGLLGLLGPRETPGVVTRFGAMTGRRTATVPPVTEFYRQVLRQHRSDLRRQLLCDRSAAHRQFRLDRRDHHRRDRQALLRRR